jgi:uncharacterized protein (TIGR03437 family)
MKVLTVLSHPGSNATILGLLLAIPVLAAGTGLPMSFEPNVGQADPRVQYVSRAKGYTLFLTARSAVLSSDGKQPLRMILAGAKPVLTPRPLIQLPGTVNSFLGNDPSHWQTRVPTYGKVAYDRVYPGIDLVYYGDSAGLEYDFIVAPGADARRIALRFEGADHVEIGTAGELVVRAGTATARWRKPLLYQEVRGRRKVISGGYELRGGKLIGFRVGPYDRKRPLVIDPVLIYSTYLGGSRAENSTGISSDDRKSAMTVDAAGNAYIAGNTESTDFIGANRGGADAFVIKLNAAGTSIVFSTYLGGSGTDRAYGIAVDSAGAVYVTGRTQSPDFPVTSALQTALRGGEDAFVTKLSPTGASLGYSTYLGGSAQDDGHAIAIDAAGYAVVTGGTESLDFPLLAAFQTTHRAGQVDAFVAKLNPQGALVFSTYLGGSSFDHPEGVATDSAGNIWVAGFTGSTDFPTNGTLQSALRGPADGFVTKLDPQGRVSFSTYLGGTGPDVIYGIAVDPAGNAYVTGTTMSRDFPVTRGVFQEQPAGGLDGFVAKLSATGSPLVYATYLGAATETAEELALAIAVDGAGSAFVTGTTTSSGFPVLDAFQPLIGGVRDAFVTGLTPDGSALVYSSFFGGSGLDYGYGIAIDGAGTVFITGRTFSEDLPVPGAIQPEFGGQGDAFVAKIATRAPAGLLRVVPAASFRQGGPLSAESIATLFGTDLAGSVAKAQSTPLPTTLAGTQLRIRDSTASERLAPLFFVAPTQVNFLIPAGTAAGPAILTVLRGEQSIATTEMRIQAVAPGVFTANADGHGVPAALATRVSPDGRQSHQLVFQCGDAAGSCKPVPIDLGSPGDQVVLTVFGTGIRGRSSLQSIQASIAGPPLEVLFAGPQGEFVGLDQVNLLLPAVPFVRDVQELRLVIDGRWANPVLIQLK